MGKKEKIQGLESGDSRERILQSAVTLFARQGYGNTGLRELSRAAEVNLAMINYFFGSKKALLREILDVFFSGYLAVAREELTGPGAQTEKLQNFIQAAIVYFDAHRDYLLVTITELPHDDPEITEHKAKWGKQMVEIIGQFLQDQPEGKGEITIQPVVFCTTLTSMMASRFLFEPVMKKVEPEAMKKISLKEYADFVCTVFQGGVTHLFTTDNKERKE